MNSRRTVRFQFLAATAAISLFFVRPAAAQADNDHTLEAMQDEMNRSVSRLQVPGQQKPFYIEYRILDLDVRSITASFGTLTSSTHTRFRQMDVNVRVGDYQLDSSNFVSENGFQGFLGSTGQVGIDRDYHSLRQDLWLATDQAYKEALVQYSNKKAFLNSLARAPEIADFSKAQPVVDVQPLLTPDWTSRNWENETRDASKILRGFPDLYGNRVHYYLVYTTYYLLTSEGTKLRMPRCLAGIEASLDTQAVDGMPLHNFYSDYVRQPSDLPPPADVSKDLVKAAQQLEALRTAPNVSDYEGPVLFDAPAATSLLAQVLEPSLSGARPPLSSMPAFDQMVQQVGGRNDWSGRINSRVLPLNVSLVDDPTARDFQGQPLLGGYDVDDEGVRAQGVSVVENGLLKDFLMSRRPGPDFEASNGHARSGLLSPPAPASSNLLFQAAMGTKSAADLRTQFLDLCKSNGQQWCLEVKRMDNPALAAQTQQDFSDIISGLAEGLSSGDRLPLLVYRVYVSDGHEELVRGAHIKGLDVRAFRTIAGIGSDFMVSNFMQNAAAGFSGTALATFGSVQGGIPSSIVAPSLLLEDVEVRGFHGEPRRLPLLPVPALP
ncbi:MAG TPA: metallopeptidase TldD-related protein [Candidatus Acidoferrales bacterium]|nr:metallopeptidase TldD-related protein [Candidatus Acidoferrales bacterium]HEV2340517.1 metallopeptidase TldD-related protein [Candidatus Acidoferrales bacterium]